MLEGAEHLEAGSPASLDMLVSAFLPHLQGASTSCWSASRSGTRGVWIPTARCSGGLASSWIAVPWRFWLRPLHPAFRRPSLTAVTLLPMAQQARCKPPSRLVRSWGQGFSAPRWQRPTIPKTCSARSVAACSDRRSARSHLSGQRQSARRLAPGHGMCSRGLHSSSKRALVA